MAATLSAQRAPGLVRNVSFPVLMSSSAPPSPSRPPHVPRVSSFTSMSKAYIPRPPSTLPHHSDADGMVPQLPHNTSPPASPPPRLLSDQPSSPDATALHLHHVSDHLNDDVADVAASSDDETHDPNHFHLHLVTPSHHSHATTVEHVTPPWGSRLLRSLSRHWRNWFTQMLHALLLALPEASHRLCSRKRRENLLFVTAVSLIFLVAAVMLALTTVAPHRSTLLRASLPLMTIPMITWTTGSVTATTTSLSVCILWFAIAASRATSIGVLAWTATIPVVASRTCGLRGGAGAAVVVAACVLQVEIGAVGGVTALNVVGIFGGLVVVVSGTLYVGSLLEDGEMEDGQAWKVNGGNSDAEVPDVRWSGSGM